VDSTASNFAAANREREPLGRTPMGSHWRRKGRAAAWTNAGGQRRPKHAAVETDLATERPGRSGDNSADRARNGGSAARVLTPSHTVVEEPGLVTSRKMVENPSDFLWSRWHGLVLT
jgi:hypothetical protein